MAGAKLCLQRRLWRKGGVVGEGLAIGRGALLSDLLRARPLDRDAALRPRRPVLGLRLADLRVDGGVPHVPN